MQRGVYFDGWFPRQHCYHPSLPPRRLGMIDDLVEFGATMLVWSALGGGSISLPYLEQEAHDDVPTRFRVYGYLNDAEFIAECGKRGIDVYGIVFEVQGWEFPVELNEDEDRILAMNELREAGHHRDTIGLREFNSNRYPKLWKAWEEYFPDGLTNSRGELVTNILEECVSRDIHGQPCHAEWVECPDREHFCYLMDRNNPVWREYLKAIIRIQVDAGVQGVQLDEPELPYGAMHYGGCFCTDCMSEFRAYLQALPRDALPEELDGVDLATFHYGRWLLERGYDFSPATQASTPLFHTYTRFQRATIAKYFAEVAEYARSYAAEQGREVKVSGNLYHVSPMYYPFEQHVDVVITEVHGQSFRQPAWNRYAAGFGRGKPVVAVENPYGGVVPALAERLKRGHSYDQFRIMQYEAAALGINMSIPYGAWMGSVIEDSFWPPHELCVEIQKFFVENERLFTLTTLSDTAIVFSTESTFQLEEANGIQHRSVAEQELPFWQVAGRMVEAKQPFDVVWFPDGELRSDCLELADLAQYRTLILPECRYLTPHQQRLLSQFMEKGGRVVATGSVGVNLPATDIEPVSAHPEFTRLGKAESFDTHVLAEGAQVTVSPHEADLALNVQDVSEREAALHIIRYDYDELTDQVPPLPQLDISIRLSRPFDSAVGLSPSGEVPVQMEREGSMLRLRLHDVPLYCVVLLGS